MQGKVTVSAVVALAACAPAELSVQVPFPQQARTALIALEHEGSSRIFGVDVAGRSQMPLLSEVEDVSDSKPLLLTVLAFEASSDALNLGALGAGARELVSTAGGDPLSATTISELSTTIGSGPVPEWAASAVRPAALANFLVPRQPRCRRTVNVARWDVTTPNQGVVGLLPLEDGSAGLLIKVFGVGSTLYRGLPNGQLAPVYTIPETEIEVVEAKQDPNGQVWMVGGGFGGGRMARLRPDHSVELLNLNAPPPAGYFLVFDFGTAAEPDTIYAVTNQGQLYRWSTGLEELAPINFTGTHRPAVRVRGPRDVYFTQPGGAALLHAHDGTVTREPTMIDPGLDIADDHVISIGLTGADAIAGLFSGSVLRREPSDGRWTSLGPPILVSASIWAIAPYTQGGLVVAGEDGIVQQYYPSEGLCKDNAQTGARDYIYYALSIGDDIWVAGKRILVSGEVMPFLAHVAPQ